MTRPRLWNSAALVAALASGCTSFRTGEEPRDSGVAVVDAGASDAPVEGPPRFCDTISPPPYFCADFEGEDVRARWLNEGQTPDLGLSGGGKTERVELVDAREELGRYAARFETPALTTRGKTAKAFLALELPESRELALTFEMRILKEQIEPTGRVALLSMTFGPRPPNEVGAILLSRAKEATTNFDVFEGAGVDGTLLSDTVLRTFISVNEWTEVQILSRDVDGGKTALVVRIAGETYASPVVPESFFPNPMLLQLGLPLAIGPSDIYRLEIDNVRIYLTQGR